MVPKDQKVKGCPNSKQTVNSGEQWRKIHRPHVPVLTGSNTDMVLPVWHSVRHPPSNEDWHVKNSVIVLGCLTSMKK